MLNISEATATGYRISSPFKAIDSAHSTPHSGVDVAIPEGTDLHSIADAVVVAVGEGPKLGNYVKIQLEDGTQVIYGHLSKIKVKMNEILQQGDIVGLSGNTGNSTGPHLHLQMMKDGELINPEKFVDESLEKVDSSSWNKLSQMSEFFSDIKQDGLWYAMTGQHFKEWSLDTLHALAQFLVDSSDVAIVVALVLGLLTMMGSKKCGTYLYWTVGIYLIIKALGVYL